MTAVLNRKKNLESVFHPPPSPKVFRRRKGSQTMHSVSVTPIYQPCEQGVSLLYFLCFLGFSFLFLFFFGVGGGEGGGGWGEEEKGGRSHSTCVIFSLKFSFTLFHMFEPFYQPVFLQLSVFLPSHDVP